MSVASSRKEVAIHWRNTNRSLDSPPRKEMISKYLSEMLTSIKKLPFLVAFCLLLYVVHFIAIPGVGVGVEEAAAAVMEIVEREMPRSDYFRVATEISS